MVGGKGKGPIVSTSSARRSELSTIAARAFESIMNDSRSSFSSRMSSLVEGFANRQRNRLQTFA